MLLERPAKPRVPGHSTLNDAAAVPAPGAAHGSRKGKRITDDRSKRKLGSGGRLQISGLELSIPGVTDIRKSRRMQGVEEDWPGTVSALRAHQGPSILRVQERHAASVWGRPNGHRYSAFRSATRLPANVSLPKPRIRLIAFRPKSVVLRLD